MKRLRYLLLLLPMTVIAQPIGEVDTAGTTWYDLQHNGSCGRMVAVDDEGYVHVAWMNGTNNWQRHVFYNVWDPQAQSFTFPHGVQVDNGVRAGYVTLDCTRDGWAVPFFHVNSANNYNVTACCDFPPRNGSFYCTSADIPGLWAHGELDIVNGMHVLATVIDFDPPYAYPVSYIRGQAECANQNGIVWEEPVQFDSMTTLSHVIATSRHSERIAAGWAHPRSLGWQLDNDLYIRISEDGGDNWQPALNATAFLAGDSACCDTAVNPSVCIGDTLRVYADATLLLDENDVLHAAFTARTYYDLAVCGGESYSWIDQAGIWHWSEETSNFSLIASAFYFQTVDNAIIDDGVWQTNVQRPCLAVDTANGYLYCAYMQYDSNCYSDVGYLMADVFISVSTDNGVRWSVGMNVTNTCPGENIPAPGSMHEREPTLAEVVTDGTLHLTYVLDHDAGSMPHNEGPATQNEFIYQRIPVNSIPTTPLVPNYPLHYDSSGFVKAGERAASVPQDIELEAAYPNPFNSSTTITFDLPRRLAVEVTVFDVLGREVTTLHRGVTNSGQHQLTWSPNVGSGIYFIQLTAGHEIRTQKVMYLK